MSSYLHTNTVPKQVQVQELVNFLDKLQFGNEVTKESSTRIQIYKKLVDDKAIDTILSKLVEEQDLVLQKGNRAEIENFYAIFSTLSAKPSKDFITKITERLTNDHTNKKVERLSVLGHLYNLSTEHPIRYHLLLSILDYSASSDQTSAIESTIDNNPSNTNNLDNRLKELNLNNKQKRTVYELILKHLKNNWASTTALDYWIKYFSSFEDKETVPPTVLNEAKNLIVIIVKQMTEQSLVNGDNIIKFNELLDTLIIRQLKSNKEFNNYYVLFEIFIVKGYKEFIDFHKLNKKWMEEQGFQLNKLLHGIRLLSLNTLAASKSVITFDEISKLIEIPEADVEFFVVEAITEEIILARIDQVNKRVIVRYVQPRVFNKEEWKKLDEKVIRWKSNMQNLLNVVQSVKEKRSEK